MVDVDRVVVDAIPDVVGVAVDVNVAPIDAPVGVAAVDAVIHTAIDDDAVVVAALVDSQIADVVTFDWTVAGHVIDKSAVAVTAFRAAFYAAVDVAALVASLIADAVAADVAAAGAVAAFVDPPVAHVVAVAWVVAAAPIDSLAAGVTDVAIWTILEDLLALKMATRVKGTYFRLL